MAKGTQLRTSFAAARAYLHQVRVVQRRRGPVRLLQQLLGVEGVEAAELRLHQ